MFRVIYLLLILLAGTEMSLSAQPIKHHKIVTGKVLCGGRGVSGVQVTDGSIIVTTDSKGAFEIETDQGKRFVYYTLPEGYNSPIENGVPNFFQQIDDKSRQKITFEIVKDPKSQKKHAFVVWADPQVIDMEEFDLLGMVVDDLNETVRQYSSSMSVHAISCGDNVFDKMDFFEPYKKQVAKTGIPFYQVLGNHDMDYTERTDETSNRSFTDNFGPDYYSFNRGDIHYVVLNDVFYFGHIYHYLGYVDETQLSWLEKDLGNIKPGSTVVVSLHIPTHFGGSQKPHSYTSLERNSMMNNKALYKILEPYNVHIMAGHSHTQWNTQISSTILEHTHAAASAAWWQGQIGLDGTPKGYTVYEVDGGDLKWYFKGVDLSKEIQLKAYHVGSDPRNPESIIANVFNYDKQWKVCWYENGKLMGEMEQFWGEDPDAREAYQPGRNKKYSWLSVDQTNHLFRAVPRNPESEIVVEVTDRFGNKYTAKIR